MAGVPNKDTRKGGGKYHVLTATAKFRAFQQGMTQTVAHTAAERADRERERAARDIRKETNTEQPTGGS